MKATTHALAGGLVGALAGRPGVAFIAGMASHALLDVLPHRDDDRTLHVIIDGCGALAVLALAAVAGNIGMAAGVLGGVLPDLENLPDILFKRRAVKIFPSHWWDHERASAGGLWAGLEAVVLIAAGLGFAALLHRTGPSGVFK
jgi:hypothetical protein